VYVNPNVYIPAQQVGIQGLVSRLLSPVDVCVCVCAVSDTWWTSEWGIRCTHARAMMLRGRPARDSRRFRVLMSSEDKPIPLSDWLPYTERERERERQMVNGKLVPKKKQRKTNSSDSNVRCWGWL